VDQLLAADEATLSAVPGVGPAAAAAVRAFFRDDVEGVAADGVPPDGAAEPAAGVVAPPGDDADGVAS